MAMVVRNQHFGPNLHRLMYKTNPTLEYTAPYGLFGDQEIILMTLLRQDDIGLWINLDCEGLGCRRAPTSTKIFPAC